MRKTDTLTNKNEHSTPIKMECDFTNGEEPFLIVMQAIPNMIIINRGGRRKKKILRCIAILSSTILNLFFFSHMARVRARDAPGFIAQNLRCETRAHCLTMCASTHCVLL